MRCVAGALEVSEFERLLLEVGFIEPEIEPTRIYELADAREFLVQAGLDPDAVGREIEGRIMAAFVRARKPQAPDSAGAPDRLPA